MIGYLQGRPLFIENDLAIIDVRGVGYEVHCSQFTLDGLSKEEPARLWIYTHVREDQLQLFGFSSSQEKQFFLSLIKVNGVGPKMAMAILSAAPLNQLIEMVEAGDVKGLTRLPKVGKKTAEQIILSLKGKLVFAADPSPDINKSNRTEIVSALVHLGFRLSDVESVVEQMRPDIDLQDGIREGLKALANQ